MMKLGMNTAILGDLPLEEVAKYASSIGLESLETACWPVGKAERRYAGVTHIDVSTLTKEKAQEILGMLAGYRLSLDSLAYSPNPLVGDEQLRTDLYAQAQGVVTSDYQSYTGHAWYQADIELTAEQAGGKLRLRFPGLFNECWLYVNGQEVAHRPFKGVWWMNDYRFEWDVDLTGKLKKAIGKGGSVDDAVLSVVRDSFKHSSPIRFEDNLNPESFYGATIWGQMVAAAGSELETRVEYLRSSEVAQAKVFERLEVDRIERDPVDDDAAALPRDREFGVEDHPPVHRHAPLCDAAGRLAIADIEKFGAKLAHGRSPTGKRRRGLRNACRVSAHRMRSTARAGSPGRAVR